MPDLGYAEWVLEFYGFSTRPDPIPNIFKRNPEPREGFIDARRTDGCVPVITSI